MPEDTEVQPTSINDLHQKMRLQGIVTRTELYGAFVNLGLEREGLIHISRLDQNRVRKVTDRVKVGDHVTVWVQSVDPDQGRIALTMVEPAAVDWDDLQTGNIVSGKVVRSERYGVFVDIGAERPGLLHVREMGQYVRDPNEVVREGETIDVKILSVDRKKRQIDLTLNITPDEPEDDPAEVEEPSMSQMEIAFMQAQAQAHVDQRRVRRRSKPTSRSRSDDDYEDIYRRTLQNS